MNIYVFFNLDVECKKKIKEDVNTVIAKCTRIYKLCNVWLKKMAYWMLRGVLMRICFYLDGLQWARSVVMTNKWNKISTM